MLRLPASLLLILGGLLTLLLACSGEPAGPPTQTPVPTPTPNFDELKETSVQIPYDDLLRNNEDHVSKKVWYKGKIIQVIDDGKNEYQLRANVTRDGNFWEDTVFLSYKGPRLLEDDIIEFIGEVNGLITYEAVFGQSITIPSLRVIESRRVTETATLTTTSTPFPTRRPTSTPRPQPVSTVAPIATVSPLPTTAAPTVAVASTSIPATTVPRRRPAATSTPAAVPATPAAVVANTATPGPDREALLEQAALTWGNAYASHDWTTMYLIYSDRYKSKCASAEFAEFATSVNHITIPSIPKGATYVLESVTVSGDSGTVYAHFENDGRVIPSDDNSREATWENDSWVFLPSEYSMSLEQPCDLANYWGFDFRLPYPAGSTMQGSDGTDIIVTGVTEDAWSIVLEENQFNDPPASGNRFYMVRVEVVNVVGASPLKVSGSDFELIGNNRLVYEWFQHYCGLIPDEVNGEIYPGGSVKGNVCFEVGADEGGFVLIHNPGFSGDNRRFLSVE